MFLDKTDFDFLKENILKLQEELLDLERRADDCQKAIVRKDIERAKRRFSKTFVHKDDSNCNELIEEDDEYCPPGWKCYLRPYSSVISTEKKQKVFYTPEGRFCMSRDKALRYIEVSNDVIAQEDKDLLRRGLFSDGWAESEHVPEGWLVQVRPGKSKCYFLTQHYQLLSGKRHALRHLQMKYSDSYILRFFKHFVFKSSKENDIRIKYMTAIPYPWRGVEITDKETKTSKIHYLGADGSYHTTRALALEAAKSDTGLSKILKENFTRFISRVKPKYNHPSKPKPQSSYLTSKKRIRPRRTRNVEHNWSSDDSSIPFGWSIACESDGRKVFKDDQNIVHQSRRLALRSMFERKQKFSNLDFEKMKEKLSEDGFGQASFLPQDWLYRPSGTKREEKYISHDFNLHRTFEEVLCGLKKYGLNAEQLNAFKRNCPKQWKDGGDRVPDGWMTSSMTHYKGATIETFLSPNGKFYPGILNVLQLNSQTLSHEEREKFHSILLERGWLTDDLTPKGWFCKRFGSKIQWVSPEYER